MNTETAGEDPFRPAREDRAAVVTRLIERLPARVTAVLTGDREALVELLLIAADEAWQSRADVLGTVHEVATEVHGFADAVADCYSASLPPSDRLCDTGFALADRVDALAIEVLQRRAQTGVSDDLTVPQPTRAATQEGRHLARAHVAALRDAAVNGRVVSPLDVDAAAHLYQAVVAMGREYSALATTAALGLGGVGPAPAGRPFPHQQ